MKQGSLPKVSVNPTFESIAHVVPDLINHIFSFLPKKRYLPQRLLNKRAKHIIDLQVLNENLGQQAVRTEADQRALFDSQQYEVDTLRKNRSAILRTPKLGTGVVRPDEELIKAFEDLNTLPQDHAAFSLYRRHLSLNSINLHIIYNKINVDQLCNMFTFHKVIDLSGLYLTRVSLDIFNMYCSQGFFKLPLVLILSHNCLTHLPLDIVRFSNLQVLDVSGNQLEKLPLNMHGLAELEYLFLANNNLKEVPIALTRLTKLRTLDVRRNCLKTLPAQLKEEQFNRPIFQIPSARLDQTYAQYQTHLPQMLPYYKARTLASQKQYQATDMAELITSTKKFTLRNSQEG